MHDAHVVVPGPGEDGLDAALQVEEHDPLAALPEVVGHGLEALGRGEVGGEDVHAVDDDGDAGLGLAEAGLVDDVAHEGDRGEDEGAVEPDQHVVGARAGELRKI